MRTLPVEKCGSCEVALMCLGGEAVCRGTCAVCGTYGTYILCATPADPHMLYRAYFMLQEITPACQPDIREAGIVCPNCWNAAYGLAQPVG